VSRKGEVRKIPGREYHIAARTPKGLPDTDSRIEYREDLERRGTDKFTARMVSDALMEARGLGTVAARMLGCNVQTIYHYLDKYASCRRARAAAKAIQDDIAEGQILDAVAAGEPWAIQFYAKTQLRDRGYGDERRLDLVVKAPEPAKLTTEEFDYDDFNRRTEHALRLVARIDRTGEVEPGAAADHPADATG
jgi:hypothetical protein